jgi:hypothetical protein
VANTSAVMATNLVLTDALPSGVAHKSTTISAGSCNLSSGAVVCQVSLLSPGSALTATIVVTPASGGSLHNTAIVSGDQPDPVPENNTDSVSTPVFAAPPQFVYLPLLVRQP